MNSSLFTIMFTLIILAFVPTSSAQDDLLLIQNRPSAYLQRLSGKAKITIPEYDYSKNIVKILGDMKCAYQIRYEDLKNEPILYEIGYKGEMSVAVSHKNKFRKSGKVIHYEEGDYLLSVKKSKCLIKTIEDFDLTYIKIDNIKKAEFVSRLLIRTVSIVFGLLLLWVLINVPK